MATPAATLTEIHTNAYDVEVKRFHSVACAACQVKSGRGKMLNLSVSNKNGSTVWIQFHDSLLIPAEAAVPLHSVPVATNASRDFTIEIPFANGLWIVGSSTAFTKTLLGADDLLMVGNVE